MTVETVRKCRARHKRLKEEGTRRRKQEVRGGAPWISCQRDRHLLPTLQVHAECSDWHADCREVTPIVKLNHQRAAAPLNSSTAT